MVKLTTYETYILCVPGGLARCGARPSQSVDLLFLVTLPSGKIDYCSWPAFALDLLAVAIAAGIQTRVIASITTVIAICLMIGTGMFPSLSLIAHALDTVVLAMTGPGANSIDAKVFERQTVRLKA